MVIAIIFGQFVQSFAVDEFYNHKSQTDNEIQIENAEVGDDSQNSLETDVVLPTGLEDDNSEEEIEILVEDSDTGLIAWYIFDGNNTDLINNNNATVSGSVDYIDGVFGKGIELDGNGYVYIDDLEMNSSHRTISLWVSPYKNNSSSNILSKHGSKNDIEVLLGTTNEREYFTQINVGNEYFDLSDEASKGSTFISDYDLITETFDGNEIRLYVNGILKIKRSASGEICNNDLPLVIGTNAYPAGSEGYFKGCIDDLRIYNRTLSSDEVQQLYNEAREQLPVDDVPDNLEIKSKKLGKDNLIV